VEAAHARDDVTRLLLEWSRGDQGAHERLLPLVYDELRRLAGAYMRRERPNHTLQPTALVHEAYLRLVDQQRVDWWNRAQFVGVAALMMRRILANHARERDADKRGGGAERVSLSLAGDAFQHPEVDALALHEVLDRLAALDARKSQVVELKFFGGLTTGEIAQTLGISAATVDREWSFARAWLYDALDTPAP
jgi:RNA polymerase sigma factor (TIGR02999 family)